MDDINRACTRSLTDEERMNLKNGKLDDLRVINQRDGGATVSEIVPTLQSADDLAFFGQLLLNLVDATAVLGNRGVVHGDIKNTNLVLAASDGTPPALRLIDWSHAMLITDLYRLTGLREAQLWDASRPYQFTFCHPPWLMLLDLQQHELDAVFALVGADSGGGVIRFCVEVATRYLTSTPRALRQTEIINRVWSMCFEMYPMVQATRHMLEQSIGRFLPAPIGRLSRECTLCFVHSLLAVLSKWTSMESRTLFVDCVARTEIDAYGLMSALLAVLYAQRKVTNRYYSQARRGMVHDIMPFVLWNSPMDTSWLRPRFSRVYIADQRGCDPTRAFPSVGPPAPAPPQPPAAAAATGEEAVPDEFSPQLLAALETFIHEQQGAKESGGDDAVGEGAEGAQGVDDFPSPSYFADLLADMSPLDLEDLGDAPGGAAAKRARTER
jgi:hypothetical protein